MPNTFSKPIDKGQRTIDIFKAETAQGVFSGWGLSSLQQHNPTYNSYNNGTGTQNIFSGSGNTFNNSLNTTVGSGTGTNNSSLAPKGNWGLPSSNRYRRDNVGSKSNYNNSSYNNGDHQEILAKQRQRYEEKNPNAKKRHKVMKTTIRSCSATAVRYGAKMVVKWLSVITKIASSTDGFTLNVLIYRKLGNHQRSGFVLVVKVTKNDNYLI